MTLAGLGINLALGVLYTWSIFTAKFTTVVTFGANGQVQKAGESLAGAAPIHAADAAAFGLGAGVRLRPFFSLRAWPWFFVTALPWFVAVSLRRPDFPGYAFVDESLRRVATKSAGRTGPLWYFVPVLLAGSFPWIGPAIAAAVRAWKLPARRREADGRAAVFVLAWALVPLAFFSLSQSKLPGYYLPALPAVALGAGMLLAKALEDPAAFRLARTGTFVVCGVLAAVAVALVVFSGPIFRPVPLSPLVRNALPGMVFGLGAALLGGAALAFLGARRGSVWLMAAGLALPVMGTPFAGRGFLATLAADRSSRDLAASIERASRGALVVGVEAYPTSLRYYLDRPVLLSSASAVELTSNYVASRAAEFHASAGTPLRPAGWWRTALAECSEPTVFVARRGRPSADTLAMALPLIAAGGADAKFLAYGPCRPGAAPADTSGTHGPVAGPR